MTASFQLSMIILLTVAVTLLAFVVAHLLTRLIRLEKNVYGGVIDRFAELKGRSVPDAIRVHPDHPSRAIFVSEDCQSCHAVALYFKTKPPVEPTALVWRGNGIEGVEESESLKIVYRARQLFEELGLRVTPFELRIGGDGRIAGARPFEAGSLLSDQGGIA